MEKIDLNSSPSSILSATIGSVFLLDDAEFVLEGDSLVFLTLVDSEEEEEYNASSGYKTWAHVRNKVGYALMTRQEMCDMIESGNYFIE